MPIAKTGYGPTVSIRAGSTLMMGTKAINGTSYKWIANPAFNGGATPKESIIRFSPTSTKTLTITAQNKCGTAQATTQVAVMAFDGYKVKIKELESAKKKILGETAGIATCTCKCKCPDPKPCPEPKPCPPTPCPPPPEPTPTAGLDYGKDGALQIHTVGDSITNNPGWRAFIYHEMVSANLKPDFIGSLTDEYPQTPQPKHDGHSFYTTVNTLDEIVGWLAKIPKSELTIVMIGTNDVAWWIAEKETDVVTRLSTILDRVKANSPDGMIFVATIPPEGGPNADASKVGVTIPPDGRNRDSVVSIYNQGIKDLVKIRQNRGEKIQVVDVFSALGKTDLVDGIHPSTDGNNKIGALIFAKIKELSPVPIPPTPTPNDTIRVKGTGLQDACGKDLILRGVNQMTVWTDWTGTPRDGAPMFGEIAKTGANSVRISWVVKDANKDVPAVTVSQLDAAIKTAVDNKMIPIVGLWDKTCMWSAKDVSEVIAWWTQPDVVALIKKHQKYLIVNFANEMGYSGLPYSEYISEYKRAITALRTAGIKVPILIDASSCGQDELSIAAAAPELMKLDANVLFGLHMWWTDQSLERIQKTYKAMADLKIPFVVSEFAESAVDCKTPILYKEIITQAQKNGVGYLPWSWDNASACMKHAMTTDSGQSFSTLSGWGLEVMVTDPSSVKNTSVKSACF
jgi:mannan endo-1,4-beta-mannosidase